MYVDVYCVYVFVYMSLCVHIYVYGVIYVLWHNCGARGRASGQCYLVFSLLSLFPGGGLPRVLCGLVEPCGGSDN